MDNYTSSSKSNYRCYFCYIDEIGLCDTCLENYKNVCLNCIIRGDMCQKCLINTKQNIYIINETKNLINWIKENDIYFSNLCPSS